MGLLSSIGSALKGAASGFLGSGGNPIGALIGGGASLLGGMMQNNSAADAASDQQNFQENMSNTSYQRAVADMKAAGLNPMLAYSQGGASVPNGSTYSPQDVVTPAVHSAKSTLEAQNMSSQIYATRTQGILNDSLAAKAVSESQKIEAETQAIKAQMPRKEFMNRGFDIGNKLLSPIDQLIRGDNSARSIDLLPPPVFDSHSAKSHK